MRDGSADFGPFDTIFPAGLRAGRDAAPVFLLLLGIICILPGWAGTKHPFGMACIPCFAVASLYLRHFGLAALTVVAPLPAAVGRFGVFSEPQISHWSSLSYAFAFGIALLVADVISKRVAAESPPPAAPGSVLYEEIAMVFFCVVAALLMLFSPRWGAGIVGSALLAGFLGCGSAILGVGLGATLLVFNEDFVARANRARERRARWIAYPATIVQEWRRALR